MSLPDANAIRRQYFDFVEDLRTSITSFLDSSRLDGDLRGIFKSASAGHVVFSSFAAGSEELLLAAAGIARRCAVLAVCHQLSLARVELRRMIECVIWYAYFLDHPVERAEFVSRPGRGWGDRAQSPIISAASAPPGTFFAYAKERLDSDKSNVGKTAVDTLHVEYGNLSGEVHAAMGAVHPSGSLALGFDKYDKSLISKLRREIHRVLSASVVACAATDPRLLRTLDASGRAWFDWLASPPRAAVIGGATFGIQR